MKKLLTIGLVSIFAFMLMPQAMAATPTITSISPSTMYFSGSAFTSSGTRYLYIWGSSFETNAKVIIDSGSNGSQTLTPYTVQNGFIGVQVSSDKLSNGTHSVLVQNPVIFAGTETSNTKTFTVTGSSYTGSSDNSGDDPEESTDDPEDSGDEPEESGDDPEDSGDEPEDSNDGSEEGTDNTCTSIFGFAINCPEDQTDESGDD
ncbi:MAG: hypothetical protein Q8Q32_00585, partial [bacterium]|nr:hypothetical protein [bacterium]